MIVTNEAEVVDAVRDARERRRTLEIVGAGTKRAFGRPMQCDEILDVSALSGIVSYQPEELLLTVLPGTPVAEINQVLAQNGQRLGFDPGDWGPLLGAKANAGTIGGAISADVCGPAAVRYGRARDQLLGYRAVNGFGEAYKAGGKVVKNVTGFDLPKLMCGAMGTLGVLTEVTLRVFPKPQNSAVLAVRGLNGEESLDLLGRVWSSPLESTGLGYSFEDGIALIRLEGAADVLSEKIAHLRRIQGAEESAVAEWGDASVLSLANGGSFPGIEQDVWRVFVPPADAASLLSELGVRDWHADWAGGLLWIGVWARDSGIHDIAARHGGRAILLRASEDTRLRVAVVPPETPARAALTKMVKAAFDPLGIFNPGRMYEGV